MKKSIMSIVTVLKFSQMRLASLKGWIIVLSVEKSLVKFTRLNYNLPQPVKHPIVSSININN